MRMPQDAQQIRELATYYDEAETSQDLERAQRDDSVVAEPMVTTSLRLPRSTINDLRHHAEERGVRPTQLIREWVEAGLAGAEGGGDDSGLATAEARPRGGREPRSSAVAEGGDPEGGEAEGGEHEGREHEGRARRTRPIGRDPHRTECMVRGNGSSAFLRLRASR